LYAVLYQQHWCHCHQLQYRTIYLSAMFSHIAQSAMQTCHNIFLASLALLTFHSSFLSQCYKCTYNNVLQLRPLVLQLQVLPCLAHSTDLPLKALEGTTFSLSLWPCHLCPPVHLTTHNKEKHLQNFNDNTLFCYFTAGQFSLSHNKCLYNLDFIT